MYRVTVQPRPRREADIGNAKSETNDFEVNHDVFEGKQTILPVIMLPIDVPVYRMANGRTQTDQYAYIREHGKPSDFFSSGEENQSAQQAQHSILHRMSREQRDSIAAIYDELQRRRQTDTILITSFGQVVNGNRRLAAMRELSLLDSAYADSFKTVKCAILPPLTELQVDELEMRLQMSPETKLPYSWVNEALKIRRLLDQEQTEMQVARMMNRQRRTVRKTVQALNYADIYLSEWRNSPQDYELVEDGKQFFHDLVQNLDGKDGNLHDASLMMAFATFDSPRKGRVYNLNAALREHADEMVQRIAERIESSESNEADSGPPVEEVFVDLGSASKSDPRLLVGEYLSQENNREEVVELVSEVARATIEKHSTIRSGRHVLNVVRETRNSIKELDLSSADPKTHKAILAVLDDLIDSASKVRAKLYQSQAVTK